MTMTFRGLPRRMTSFLLFVLIALTTGTASATSVALSTRSIGTVKAPNVVFQGGIIANATIYTNSTSAIVTTPTSYVPTSYNIVAGTYSSGTVPGSVSAVDSNYFIVSAAGVNPRTAEIEFIFGVSTVSPTQLNLTIVEQYDVGTVSVTIQVFNYTGNAYPTTGQGYLTYSSSATAGTDETQSLVITTNPQFYVSGAQQVKVRILASRNGAYNQKVNLVKLFYYQASPTFNYVLKIANQQASSYTIKLDASPFAPSNIGRVTNFTAWFYNPGSVQLQVLSGALTIPTGPTYTFGASATIFLAIRLTTTGPGLSTVDSYLRIYPSGSTTTHTDYRLTFKVT